MIKYSEAELLDVLSVPYSEELDIIAISYAIRMVIREMMGAAVSSRMYGNIGDLPEKILDYMAIELKTPYYEESLGIEQKQALIRKTLTWRFKAGTKAAVEEIAQTIFGDAEVIEWFHFKDEEKIPGQFDIKTLAQFTPESFRKFERVIELVKNETSHLRVIRTERQIEGGVYIANAVRSRGRFPIGNTLEAWNLIFMNAHTAATLKTRSKMVIGGENYGTV